MTSTNEVGAMSRGMVNVNLWWHFIEGLEYQILNLGVSTCFVKQRWATEDKHVERHH